MFVIETASRASITKSFLPNKVKGLKICLRAVYCIPIDYIPIEDLTLASCLAYA